jgi:hypothetical protein
MDTQINDLDIHRHVDSGGGRVPNCLVYIAMYTSRALRRVGVDDPAQKTYIAMGNTLHGAPEGALWKVLRTIRYRAWRSTPFCIPHCTLAVRLQPWRCWPPADLRGTYPAIRSGTPRSLSILGPKPVRVSP